MSTGVTDNKDGTHTIHGEVFSFRRSQRYVLFAHGKTVDGKLIEPLTTSSCEPDVSIDRAGPTSAVLYEIAKRRGSVLWGPDL